MHIISHGARTQRIQTRHISGTGYERTCFPFSRAVSIPGERTYPRYSSGHGVLQAKRNCSRIRFFPQLKGRSLLVIFMRARCNTKTGRRGKVSVFQRSGEETRAQDIVPGKDGIPGTAGSQLGFLVLSVAEKHVCFCSSPFVSWVDPDILNRLDHSGAYFPLEGERESLRGTGGFFSGRKGNGFSFVRPHARPFT